MISRNVIISFIALIGGLAGINGQAWAERTGDFEFSDELDACVAALNDEIDLNDVQRIRHIVTKYDTKGRGYSLTIRTHTYSATAEKQYSAICVATGKNQPSRLEVTETNT
jgi:hypothetical protein